MFKKIFFLVCIAPITISSQEISDSFSRACKEYEQGQVQKAYDLFNSIENKSPAVLYNMAACSQELHDPVTARVYWIRAAKEGSGFIVPQALKHAYQAQRNSLWSRLRFWIFAWVVSIPLGLLQIVFLCAWLLFLIFVCFKRFHIKLVACSSILTLLLGSSLLVCVQFKQSKSCCIKIDNALVYTGPDERFHEQFSLSKGDVVSLCAQKDGWCKISSNGSKGWIAAASLYQV